MNIELKINPEYEALMPSLSQDEYGSLKESIRKNGLYFPIIVNPKGHILDGHHRFRACREVSVKPEHTVKKFDNSLLEKRFVIEANIQRRQLTPFEKIERAMPLLEIERELAKQRQLEGTSSQIWDKGRATRIVAKKVGVSHGTFEMGLKLIEEAPKEVKQKLRNKERAISAAYKEIVHEKRIHDLKEKITDLAPLEGKYRTIVVDPPWPYGTKYNPEGRRVASPYPEMSINELEKLELPVAPNCVLWFWTTNRFMHDAFHLLNAWGFEPKTILTWVKDRIGIGSWLRGQTEHCILAVKGKPTIDLKNQSTALLAKTQGHSRKPKEFYTLVESLCDGKKLDYFAGEHRAGWDVYGTIEEVKQ